MPARVSPHAHALSISPTPSLVQSHSLHVNTTTVCMYTGKKGVTEDEAVAFQINEVPFRVGSLLLDGLSVSAQIFRKNELGNSATEGMRCHQLTNP